MNNYLKKHATNHLSTNVGWVSTISKNQRSGAQLMFIRTDPKVDHTHKSFSETRVVTWRALIKPPTINSCYSKTI